MDGPFETCRACHWLALVLEAAQLAIDLAVAQEHMVPIDNVEAVLKQRSLAETVPW
jgi:hypothetical protein